MRRFLYVNAALALLLGSGEQAKAGSVTFYTSEAAFSAAAPSLTTVDFAGLVTNGSYEQGYPSGFTIQGNTFIADNGYLLVRAPGALESDASVYGPSGGFIGVNPASDTTGVGTDLSAFYGNAGTVTLAYTLTDGTASSFTLTSTNGSFLGIVSDIPIANITFTDSNDYPILDHFTVESAAVAEPAALTLLGTGIAGMAGYGWRRKKAVTA